MATVTEAPALPGARASARYVRTSAMKARRVVDLIRGLPAREALTVLQFAPQQASGQVYKVLASAMANAENNEQLDPDSLLVAEAYVDEGPTMKRFRPRAQGRAFRIRKRTCHITVVVESVTPAAPPAPRPARKQPAKAAAAPEAGSAATDQTSEVPAEKATAKKAAKKTTAKKTTKKAAAAEPEAAEDTTAAEAAAKTTAKKTAAKKTTAKKAPKKAAPEQSAAEEGTE